MDKITKLSQAIRLGATFRPQCRGGLFHSLNRDADGRIVVGSCAIGAAFEATSQLDAILDAHASAKTVDPRLRENANRELYRFYDRFNISYELRQEIVSMNDNQFLTREEIADRLEARGL